MIYSAQNINNGYFPALSETFGVHTFLEGGTNIVGEWIEVLFYIWQIMGSSSSPEIDYPT